MKLLFTVGAHEGLKRGSESGRKGIGLASPRGISASGVSWSSLMVDWMEIDLRLPHTFKPDVSNVDTFFEFTTSSHFTTSPPR